MRRNEQGITLGGYTLVEVLVLVTVLGIAGALVIPQFEQTNVLREQAAVRTVVSDITYAQSDALAFQRGRAIRFDEALNEYTLIEVTGPALDPVNDALYAPHGPAQRYVVARNDERYGGVELDNVNFNGTDDLIFDALGGPVTAPQSDVLSASGSLDIVGPVSTWRLTIAAFSGRVTVQRVAP